MFVRLHDETARGIAVAALLGSIAMVLTMGLVAVTHTGPLYVGFDLALVGWLGFGLGSLVWLIETSGNPAVSLLIILLVMWCALGLSVASLATWEPQRPHPHVATPSDNSWWDWMVMPIH